VPEQKVAAPEPQNKAFVVPTTWGGTLITRMPLTPYQPVPTFPSNMKVRKNRKQWKKPQLKAISVCCEVTAYAQTL